LSLEILIWLYNMPVAWLLEWLVTMGNTYHKTHGPRNGKMNPHSPCDGHCVLSVLG
jgi:hypothetical protein